MVLATDTAMAMDMDTVDTAGPTDMEDTVLTATATDTTTARGRLRLSPRQPPRLRPTPTCSTEATQATTLATLATLATTPTSPLRSSLWRLRSLRSLLRPKRRLWCPPFPTATPASTDTEASTVDTTDTPWSTPLLARLCPPSPPTPTLPTATTTVRGLLMLSRRLRLMLMPRLTPG